MCGDCSCSDEEYEEDVNYSDWLSYHSTLYQGKSEEERAEADAMFEDGKSCGRNDCPYCTA